MGDSFELAAEALYAGPLGTFAAERKRLATELRTAGDKAGAAAFNKLGRPSPSAWAVNQLFRQARAEWEALVAATARLGKGELAAMADERAALGQLRAKGAERLRAEGNVASEQTLSRLETNLRSVMTTGWGADGAGRLVDDRPPPGFDALAGLAAMVPQAAPAPAPVVEAVVPAPQLKLVPPLPDEAALQRARELEQQQRAAQREAAKAAAVEAHAQLDRSSARVAGLETTLAEAKALHAQFVARAAQADQALDALEASNEG
jgi:hypothetical protein